MSEVFDPSETVQKIIDGQIDPTLLSRGQRRNCVEFARYSLRWNLAKIGRLLKVGQQTIRGDLRVIHEGIAASLQHGQIASEIVGELYERLQTNYQMALEKRDVAGANKATEALKEFWQDLGRFSKADTVLVHKGLDILELAQFASDDESAGEHPPTQH